MAYIGLSLKVLFGHGESTMLSRGDNFCSRRGLEIPCSYHLDRERRRKLAVSSEIPNIIENFLHKIRLIFNIGQCNGHLLDSCFFCFVF